MITDEDIEKIARRVLEMQIKEGTRTVNGRCTVSDIIDKYHNQLYSRFGATGQIESAIRTVAVYKVGERYIARVPENKFEECRNYAEKLCKDILGECDNK